jgi:hypothetical protein
VLMISVTLSFSFFEDMYIFSGQNIIYNLDNKTYSCPYRLNW